MFLQRVWTSGVLAKLAPAVQAGCNKNEKSGMFATGVPPHLVIANSVVGVQKELDELRIEVVSKLDSLPEALKQSMLQNFTVDGTVPITHVQVVDMMADLKVSIETSLVSAIRRDRENNQAVSASPPHVEPSESHSGSQSTYLTWSWGGRFHPVPQNFRFPR